MSHGPDGHVTTAAWKSGVSLRCLKRFRGDKLLKTRLQPPALCVCVVSSAEWAPHLLSPAQMATHRLEQHMKNS